MTFAERIIKLALRGALYIALGILVAFVGVAVTTRSNPFNHAINAPARMPEFAGLTPTDADYVDPRLLTSDPSGHVGEHIWLKGTARNVEQSNGYTWISLQAETGRGGAEEVVVHLYPAKRDLLSRETYCIYGKVGGTTKAIRTLTGVEFTAPLVNAYAAFLTSATGDCN